MNFLGYEMKYDKAGSSTIEDAENNMDFVDSINYLVSEGFIELQEDSTGDIRAYPTS